MFLSNEVLKEFNSTKEYFDSIESVVLKNLKEGNEVLYSGDLPVSYQFRLDHKDMLDKKSINLYKLDGDDYVLSQEYPLLFLAYSDEEIASYVADIETYIRITTGSIINPNLTYFDLSADILLSDFYKVREKMGYESYKLMHKNIFLSVQRESFQWVYGFNDIGMCHHLKNEISRIVRPFMYTYIDLYKNIFDELPCDMSLLGSQINYLYKTIKPFLTSENYFYVRRETSEEFLSRPKTAPNPETFRKHLSKQI